MNLRFIYDIEHLHRYRLSLDPLSTGSKVKTVGAVLDILRYSWDMKVLIDDDGFIYIAHDIAHLLRICRHEPGRDNFAILAFRYQQKKEEDCSSSF